MVRRSRLFRSIRHAVADSYFPAVTTKLTQALAVMALLVLSTSWATTSTFSGSSASSAPTASSASSAPLFSTASAVAAVTTRAAAIAAAAVPADFESVMGYRPQVRDGLLVDPEGTCSSPIPLPEGFTPACAEHDLGYDLLRYAALTGDPLDAWARTAVDDRLSQRMRAVCAALHSASERAVCSTAAFVTASTVEVNSVRQFRGVPEESPASLAVTAVALAAAVVACAGLVARRRRRGSLREPRPREIARGVPA
jgi:hypothetical protein